MFFPFFFFFLAQLALLSSGDTVGLNRWKDGADGYLVALCLPDQKASSSIRGPNKLDLKFSILQIPKQQNQVEGKSCRGSSLELSALFTVDINSEASDEPEQKGQETETDTSFLMKQCLFRAHIR